MENPFGVVVGFLLDGTCSHVVLVPRREMFPPNQKMMVTELSETSKANLRLLAGATPPSRCMASGLLLVLPFTKKIGHRPSPNFRQLVHARARDHGLPMDTIHIPMVSRLAI